MSSSSIARVKFVNQVPMEGSNELLRVAVLREFVRGLINDNAYYEHGALSLSVSDLSKTEKRLLLGNLILAHPTDFPEELEDVAFMSENDVRLEAAIKEYSGWMQQLIDDQIDGVWHDIMREAGRHLCSHHDNGEIYYSVR